MNDFVLFLIIAGSAYSVSMFLFDAFCAVYRITRFIASLYRRCRSEAGNGRHTGVTRPKPVDGGKAND